MWVQFKYKHCNVNIFYVHVVHLPPENSTRAVNVHEFMETLMTHIYTIPQGNLFYLCDDFNSRCSDLSDLVEGIDCLPEHDIVDFQTNGYGNIFCDFLIDVDCCILNGRKTITNDFTFVSTHGFSVVDYCVFDSFNSFSVTRATTIIQSLGEPGRYDLRRIVPDHSLLTWNMCLYFSVIDQVSKNKDKIQTEMKLKYDTKSIPEDWLRGESVVTEINRVILQLEQSEASQQNINKMIGVGSKRQNTIPMEIKLNDGSICDDKNMVINKWKCDFEEMLNKNSDNSNETENCNSDIICDEILDGEITTSEVYNVVKVSKCGKSPGVDDIPLVQKTNRKKHSDNKRLNEYFERKNAMRELPFFGIRSTSLKNCLDVSAILRSELKSLKSQLHECKVAHRKDITESQDHLTELERENTSLKKHIEDSAIQDQKLSKNISTKFLNWNPNSLVQKTNRKKHSDNKRLNEYFERKNAMRELPFFGIRSTSLKNCLDVSAILRSELKSLKSQLHECKVAHRKDITESQDHLTELERENTSLKKHIEDSAIQDQELSKNILTKFLNWNPNSVKGKNLLT
ncbi:unnamed protein product [Mytilus coruscus]|uniref:Endonuclease/exonuclease/phosphatase domain-containing protein n=1 Tax=Mytilus coruscus TaxID=42192 RepID=A0A6J8A3U4_MYTCO|nr:unnamed protein product [Mytilus coruscus]